MVRKNKNIKPRLNWQGDENHLADLWCEGDAYSVETEESNDDDDTKVMLTAETEDGVPSFQDAKEISEILLNDEQILNEIEDSFDDVTLNDTDVLELGFSDDLAIENNSVLSNTDETASVLLFAKEMSSEQKSDSSYEDDWDVLTATQSLKDSNSLYSMIEDGWDAVSSVNSVMSIDTFQTDENKLSYKDMVVKKISTNILNNNSQKRLLKDSNLPKEEGGKKNASSSAMLPIDENDYSDIYEEYEGYKYSRGGKDALKFRGLDRHQRGKTSNSYKYHTKNYRKGTSRNGY